MNFQLRQEKFQNWIDEKKLDGFLITSPANLHYITGFTGSFGFAVITPNDKFFFTDSRYTLQAAGEAPDFHHVKLEKFSPMRSVIELSKDQNITVLGFESEKLNYSQYRSLAKYFGRANLLGYERSVEHLREVKDHDEIEILRQAEAIGDMAFKEILNHIKPGVTEKEIALQLDFYMRHLGASASSFPTIIASGKRSALPHGVASDKPLEYGDMIVMDYGCVYNRYCSDMTRTVVLGEPSSEMCEIYDLVLKAQLEALEYIKSGVSGKSVHEVAEKVFAKAGKSDYFGHGLGHSVGLEIHEKPSFNLAEKNLIQAGNVITVEPGLYLPDQFGVRIEDMIVVTEDGYDNLTKSPKELIIL